MLVKHSIRKVKSEKVIAGTSKLKNAGVSIVILNKLKA